MSSRPNGQKDKTPAVPADAPELQPENPVVAASRRATASGGEEPDEEENEVLREARRMSELRDRAEAAARKVGWKAAAGIGIGSAALLAAALYANRKRD